MSKDKTSDINEPKKETLELRRERAKRNRTLSRRGPLYIPEDQKDPNFVYRIVADRGQGARVQQLLDLGYEFVTNKDMTIGDESLQKPAQLGAHVTRALGGGENGILMRIPKEIYEDARKLKDADVDRQDAALLKPNNLLPATYTKTTDI